MAVRSSDQDARGAPCPARRASKRSIRQDVRARDAFPRSSASRTACCARETLALPRPRLRALPVTPDRSHANASARRARASRLVSFSQSSSRLSSRRIASRQIVSRLFSSRLFSSELVSAYRLESTSVRLNRPGARLDYSMPQVPEGVSLLTPSGPRR